MKNFAMQLQKYLLSSLCLLVAGTASVPALAQTAPSASIASPRIAAEINPGQLTPLPDSKDPLALAKYDGGRVAASTKLEGISIYFSHTQSQEAALKALIAAQQNPSSPQYHQWLTPEQFGSRFGLADSDIAKVQSWLEQQGFSIDSVARGKQLIRFSGTVAQAEAAFGTELHNYSIPTATGVEKHFAPSTAISVPAALAGVVQSVHNLDNFRPKSHLVSSKNRILRANPNFTSSQTQSLFFAPGDIATVYDIQKEYNASFTGVGQSIAIVGQSQIDPHDIENFQNAAGLAVKDPTTILVPGTGSAAFETGDETESDLDLEWSGAIAKGATIYFVYTGTSDNNGAFDALTWVVDNKLGNIVSTSYGTCETNLGSFTLEPLLQQAASQGQTVVAASGDDGATDCFPSTNLTVTQQQTNAVDYPASSQYVTGLGGTEVSQANAAYLTAGSAYWDAAGSNDVITSALQYIPEVAWNEDTAGCGQADCLGASGGGASAIFPKPSWQTGPTGIPSDNKRDVPDIALAASTGLPGYLFCSSDPSFWGQNQVASCNSGFRDSSTGDLTIAGGTSFAAPIFSGMLALINQQQNYTTGQGLINPTLYSLASDSSIYASAFHDIVGGNNDCPSGTGLCNSTVTGFAAVTGYDQVTGLGSIDLFNLASAWSMKNTGPALTDTTTVVSASSASPNVGATDTFTITVAPAVATPVAGAPTPSGTVTITVDSGTPITGNTLTSNGTFTYTTSFSSAGMHQVLVTYSGDSTYAASTGTATVTAVAPNSGTGTFTLKATGITVSDGNSGASTITVTPASGYTGTIDFSLDSSNDNALQNICWAYGTQDSSGNGILAVSGTSAVTTTLTIYTNATFCATQAAVQKNGKSALHTLRRSNTSSNNDSNRSKSTPGALALAGLLLFGFAGRYAKKFRGVAGILLLIGVGFAISACGGSNSNTIPNPAKGSYTMTLSGQDSSTASINATTTFTLVIQ
ncbi:protease pro-enzyme activation domain-containing protein [Acidicapsa ligni]|uniref:protease pro-enzyme activation domain-containing protein n=1 Tax=Acidicapsa ligni TaxID=542300 RepID=UPI0021DFD44D|nr:protease pro-enzyme activation domain-containing protein [Acidicapsa ligni]